MNRLAIPFLLLLAGAIAWAQVRKPDPSLTCVVRDLFGNRELCRFTNALSVKWDHENAKPPCHLIRYVQDGKTNEFHAWMVSVDVKTNKPSK